MELWGPTLVGELWNSGAYTCFRRGELWNFQYIFMGRFRLNPRAKFMGALGPPMRIMEREMWGRECLS